MGIECANNGLWDSHAQKVINNGKKSESITWVLSITSGFSGYIKPAYCSSAKGLQ